MSRRRVLAALVGGGLLTLAVSLFGRRPPAGEAPAAANAENAATVEAGAAAAAEPVLPALADVAVGSAAVLAALWTAEDLRGRPDERRIRRQRPPDRQPPDVAALPPRPPLDDALRGSIRRVRPPAEAPLVALTFDLCERADDHTGYDGAIADALRRERVPATFFAGGKWMRSHPERARQLIADPLFEVGNHAWTHGNLRVLAGEPAERQIVWTQAEYARLRGEIALRAQAADVGAAAIAAIPAAPAVFRFPYGTCSAETLAMAGRLGLAAIQWDVVSGDAVAGTAAATVARAVLAGVRPGSIVVCHANGRGSGTAEALPTIIASLRRRGYRFVTVSTLLAAGPAVVADECYELRPGDNGRYDRLFGEGTG